MTVTKSANFSTTDVAFAGFRVVREHWGLFAIWCALALTGSLFFPAFLVALSGQDIVRLQTLAATGNKDTTLALQAVSRLLPSYLVIFVVALLLNGVVYAAVNRVVLHPEDRRSAYLRLGMDELRQLMLQVLTVVTFVCFYVGFLLIALIAGLVASTLGKDVSALVNALMVAGVLLGFTWAAIRLSLSSPLTFATGRVDLFGSWRLTRHRFWPIFGSYLLATVLALVVLVLAYVVVFAAVGLVGGGSALASMMNPDMSSLVAYFTKARVVEIVLGAFVSAMVWPLILSPPIAIYAAIEGKAKAE